MPASICGRSRHFLLFLIGLFAVFTAKGQQATYPVMVNLQLNPPYSLYLSDYAAPDIQRMQVHLLLKDLTESNYKVRLRIKIEGPGITLMSKTGFYVAPIYINGGEMITISGPDLATYLNPQNLLIQGLDNSAFTKDGAKLPEGIYKFTVEVLDYVRNTVVSNPGAAIISSFLSYPPIINLPMRDTKVDAMDPQNVVFQWMPRSTASINAAFNMVYKFRLVELVPANRDPNDAMRSLRPIYENIVDQTMLVYGPGEPALTPGNNYAVQVQAMEVTGRDMFVNDGYSEVVRFTYGEKCGVPSQIVAFFAGKNELKLTWAANTTQQQYTVRYREGGETPSQWYEDVCYLPQITLSGLKPGKKYEYQLKAQCIWGYGDYSPVDSFTMPNETMTKGDFVCGKSSAASKITNTKNIEELNKGDVFVAGDFKIEVDSAGLEASGFSGNGHVEIPLMGYVVVRVTFKNIGVNTDKRMYSGTVELARDSYEAVSKKLQDEIGNYVDRLDAILANPTVENLLSIDAAEEIAVIDRMKGWNGLDQSVLDAFDDIRAKLEELKAFQDALPDMTPEQRQTALQKVVSDLKKAKDQLKTALEELKKILAELFNLYKQAIKKLRKEYTDEKIQTWRDEANKASQQQDALNENILQAVLQNVKNIPDAGAGSGKTAVPDEVVIFDEGSLDIDEKDETLKLVLQYRDLITQLNKGIVLQLLEKDQDNEDLKQKVLLGIKVDKQTFTDYYKTQKAKNVSDEDMVPGVADGVIDLIISKLKILSAAAK
ncbi:fibronectin type III domain-containing protein [Chitinophaga sp. Cy-1792]|uniref:fibronectin type III domain-containing protein n=1 Tax=Chitinophaga sp. Cy-1792 TaxID=2608339 RepID=UPI00141F5FC2|nr:fibronectin type III domain-containing protein [Chitinophaga sp. Cy-1792]NIG56001.1 hypothetical protein [Chitinophaga sp. Cy-1792]